MTIVVISVLHVAVGVWPSVIDWPCWLLMGEGVFDVNILGVWEVVLVAVIWGVDSVSSERSSWVRCILVGLSP
jgi:hypothetical protein